MGVSRASLLRRILIRLVTAVAVSAASVGCGDRQQDTLAIGTPLPAFSLPGVDGQTHGASEFAKSPVLVIAFTCNHCPTSQLYEQRLRQLHVDYRDRGVSLVAINPHSEKTTSLRDLAYSDVPDSLAGMIERSKHRRLEYPYLYDGDTQAAAKAFKVIALPQVFVFGQERTLQYVGRIDDDVSESRVTARDLRAAIDAVLARRTPAVATTRVSGCPIERPGQAAEVEKEQAEIKAAPVSLIIAGPPELRALRANGTSKLMVVNFWATWCGPCVAEFPELQTIYRTYRSRNLEYVTVSLDVPEARPAVLKWLQERHASSRNYIFATEDTGALQEAFDPAMPASVPFTLLLAPNGDVLHQQHGEANGLELRRAILANLAEDAQYPGLQAYWATK